MRCLDVVLIEIFALAAANPVSLVSRDQLFSSDLQDLGNSPSTESLFDPLYSEDAMNTNDLFSSAVSSDPNDSLLYTDMEPGNVAAAISDSGTTLPDEPLDSLFDQDGYSIENDGLFAQFSQGEADNDCIPDVTTRGIGKMRLGRSCSKLKEAKTCDKSRSQLCCCSGRGLTGVFNLGCNASTYISFFDLSFFCLVRYVYALIVEKTSGNQIHCIKLHIRFPFSSKPLKEKKEGRKEGNLKIPNRVIFESIPLIYARSDSFSLPLLSFPSLSYLLKHRA